jgi:hypothetical protein
MSESFEVAGCDFTFLRTARLPVSAISRRNSPALDLGAHPQFGRVVDECAIRGRLVRSLTFAGVYHHE